MYRRKVQEGFVEMIDREMAGIDREMARIDREMAGIDREQGCSKNGRYKGGKLGKYRGNTTNRPPSWLSFVCNWIGATLEMARKQKWIATMLLLFHFAVAGANARL